MAALSPDWKLAVITKPDEVIVAEIDQLDTAVARCSIVQGLPHHVSFSADGEWLAWISDQGTAWAWPWRSQTEPRAVAPAVKVRDGRLDATGRLISLLDTVDKRLVHIWKLATGELVSALRHEADVTATAFDSPGDHLAVASVDYTVRVWSLGDSVQMAEFRHDADVQAVAFSPDDRCVFSAGGRSDRTARLWYWRPSDLLAEACARLDRDLTEEEWGQYLVGEAYRPTRQLD